MGSGDGDDVNPQKLSATFLPSPPITNVTTPTLVRDTGPVDADYYPIFKSESESKQRTKRSNDNTFKNELDYINNDTNEDDSISSNSPSRRTSKGKLLRPGTRTKSADYALRHYGLVDSIRPYHFSAHQTHKTSEGMLWISGQIVSTKEKAYHPSIDGDDPLHALYEKGYFKKREIVEYTLNEQGVIQQQWNPELKVSGRGRIIAAGRDRRNWGWRMRERYSGTLKASEYLVERDDIDGSNPTAPPPPMNQRWTCLLCSLTNLMGSNLCVMCRQGQRPIPDSLYVVDSKLYHIFRTQTPTPSPLKKLFHIEVTPEWTYMAWKLKDILVDIGIAHDWLTVKIIAEYMPLSYQRDLYFDLKRFEEIVHQRLKAKNKKTTMDMKEEETREIAIALTQNPRNHHWSETWPDDIEYYQSKILKIGRHQIATAPKHPLLSQNARLPQITRSGRGHIGIVAKRLDMVLRPSTNLYGYQLHTVLWCHELERSILAKQTLCIGSNDLRFCSGSNCAVYIDEKGTYSPASSATNLKKSRVIEPRIVKYGGGIISDDVGLGKTLTMLSLIAAHPHRDDIAAKSTMEYGPNGDTVRCAATLVVAPSHLIHQWKDEIDRHLKRYMLKVITITTMKDHFDTRYADILSADIVLVSGAFLNRVEYGQNCKGGDRIRDDHWKIVDPSAPIEPPPDAEGPTLRRSRRLTCKNERGQRYRDLSMNGPYLDLLHWRRFILDEGHEMLLDKKLRKNIYSITSEFQWYCTATPFPRKAVSMEYAADFLEIRLNDKFVEWTNQKGSISVLQNVIYHHLFSRHTKESIAADNHLPDIEEICKLIDFHPIERLLYETTTMLRETEFEHQKLERAICSGALEKAESGLFKSWRRKLMHNDDEATLSLKEDGRSGGNEHSANYLQRLLMYNRTNSNRVISQLNRDRSRMDRIRNDRIPTLNRYQEEYDEMERRYQRNNMPFSAIAAWPNQREREKYTHIQRKLNAEKKRIAVWEQGMDIWPSIYEKLKDDIDGEVRRFEANIASAPQGEVLVEIMRKYGSKQAFLLQNVQEILEDPQNRIIVFSLFGELLQILKKRLAMIKVDAGLCRGNVHQRRKAMRAFQREINGESAEKRVILLSSKAAASGADLKLATHIILVDPVPGSASESFAAERQAIGRAVRQGMDERGTATKVIRLVVRDSIEQETHERNEAVRAQQNSELHSNNDGVKVEGANYDLALLNGLKIEDRSNDEIDFFLNIREYAEQYKKATDSSDSKRKTARNAIVTVSRKRARSAVVKKESKSLPAKVRGDMKKEPPPKKQRRVKKEKRSESSNAEKKQPSEAVYCVCRRPHSGNEFMIQCDRCEEWFHGECVGVTEEDAEEIDDYECSLCSGPPKKKRKVNRRRRRGRRRKC